MATTCFRLVLLPLLCLVCVSCAVKRKDIGYLHTDPVSIPTAEKAFASLRLDATAIADTLSVSHYVLREVQPTVEQALSAAFRATFPTVGFGPKERYDHELRLLKLGMDRVLVDYHAHSTLQPSQLSSGPRFTSSTSTHSIHVLETRYKAVLWKGTHIVAVYEATSVTRMTNDMRQDLIFALERMAEELNTGVVRSLIGVPHADVEQ